MPFRHLPFDAPLSDYARQAGELLDGWQLGLTPGQIRATRIGNADAQLALARWYDFLDWDRLADHVQAVRVPGSDVFRFERAVEAVIDGDINLLKKLLADDPRLVRARSSRVTHFDPPVHRATLLHYLAANGVEGYRQRSPKNAADVTRVLLEAGADPNSLCSLYGSECTTMALLVSSSPPEQANVQVPILDVLIDHGASMEPAGEGSWTSPIETALVFNMSAAARRLVDRGAPVLTVAAAAGLGRIDDVRRLLPASSALDRRRALALASQAGQAQAVTLLLDAGEDPNRFNPPGTHSHTPPLHQAVASGQLEIVKLLVARGARLDIRDTIYHSTPLGWAIYCEKPEIAEYLSSRGAP